MSSSTKQSLSLLDAAECALDYAKQQGADQAEVSLHQGSGLSLAVRQQELETIEKHNDSQLSFTVFKNFKTGSSSSADLTEAGIKETVDAALSIARYTGQDKCLGLADKERMATDLKDLDQCHPWDIDVEQAIVLAKTCEQAALSSDARISNTEGAALSTYQGEGVYANSHGFISEVRGTQHSLSCSVIAANEKGMQRDYWYDSHRNAARMQSAASIGQRAGERTVARLDSRKLKSQSAPVLFDPQNAKSLIGHLLSALKGGAIYKKASFLLDRIGDSVLPEFVNISEHPHILGGNNSAMHDAEGVATPASRSIVSSGELQTYILGSYTARKLGLASTANAGGVRNVRITNTGQSQHELLKLMGTGLLVTELIGSGVNSVTGDYSRGAAGFWIENGEVAYPVEEITIAGNLLDMYRRILAIGADEDQRSNLHCGSILLENMTIAGT